MNNVKITIKPSSLQAKVDQLTSHLPNKPTTAKFVGSPSQIDLKLKLRPTPSALPMPSEPQEPDPLFTEHSSPANEYSHSRSEPVAKKTSNIKSYLRFKPNGGEFDCLQVLSQQSVACERTVYKFDRVFGSEVSQGQIFETVGKEVAQQFLEGYNGTVFAYGSTGSGKTYTMFGDEDGLAPRVVEWVFGGMGHDWQLGCSMVEIYKQNLTDLLSKQNGLDLRLKEDNIHNLAIHTVSSQQETMDLMKRGNILKRMRETHLNESSSRSHVVFTLHLRRSLEGGKSVSCKFNLVDLAGSQKVFKSKVEGQGLEEAKKINLSLSCLGNTISALVKNSDHVPWRESKLTRILKQSLMGNSITRMIVTCSVTPQAIEETVSSMKFAQRAQKVQTQAEVAYSQGKKADKREELRMLRQALKRSQNQLSSVTAIIDSSANYGCKVSQEIREILDCSKQEESLQNPSCYVSSALFSPKSRTDLNSHHFSTVPNSRFSSLHKRQSSHPANLALMEMKESMNRKISTLTRENDRLISERNKLETRLKLLEESKGSKEKRTIKLGQGKRNQRDASSENHSITANRAEVQSKRMSLKVRRAEDNRSRAQMTSYTMGQEERVGELQATQELINETLSRIEKASSEYKRTIYPLELEVLNQQVAYLQGRKPANSTADFSQEYSHILELKRKLAYFVEDLPEHLERLFEHSIAESREEVSEILREKLREISEINWTNKDHGDESCEMTQLQCLLEREKQAVAAVQTTKAVVTPEEEEKSENEFLADYVNPLPAFSLPVDLGTPH